MANFLIFIPTSGHTGPNEALIGLCTNSLELLSFEKEMNEREREIKRSYGVDHIWQLILVRLAPMGMKKNGEKWTLSYFFCFPTESSVNRWFYYFTIFVRLHH